MAGNDDILNIQRDIANRQMAERIAQQRRLQNDIRPMIARSGWYNPENDIPQEGSEYPKFVRDADGKSIKINGQDAIARNADEELAILGRKIAEPKKVSVNIEQLAETQQPVRVKRKYTKRQPVVSQSLPEPLK